MIAASYPASWLFETPTEFLRASGPLVAAGLAAAALALASVADQPPHEAHVLVAVDEDAKVAEVAQLQFPFGY